MRYSVYNRDGEWMGFEDFISDAEEFAKSLGGYYIEEELWEEDEEDYSDYDLECGFDPYGGCYSWDC